MALSSKSHQLTEQLGIQYPIICGPMYPGSNPELVAAVSEAGGMGVVQPVTMTFAYGHDFRAGLRLIRSLTDKPFGVNFTLIQGVKAYEKRNRQWMDIAIEEGVKFFLTSLGNPKHIVKQAHANGITVYHDVSTPEFAQKAMDAGVDGLNCVNNRAGGQTGTISPEAIIDGLQDCDLPLVCAGGVGDEQDFIRMLELGYAGVQMGTRFLATQECQIQPDYKQAIINAQEDDIVITNRLAGTLSSVIRTPDIEKLGLNASRLEAALLRNRRTKTLMRTAFLMRSVWKFKQVANRDNYAQYWQAGRGVGHIRSIETAGDVVRQFAHALQ